jgi:drug/metabolite transporter (DMT)-like permease
MKIPSRSRAEFYLFLLTIIWGSTFALTKFILESASPFVYIAIRFIIASILFFILYFQRMRLITRSAIIKGSILGLLLFLGMVMQTVGLKYTTASKSAFITGLMVVFTPFFQLLIEHKPPKLGNILGVVFITCGLYFMTAPEGSEFNIGDALTLVAAVSFGLYTVYLDIFSKVHDPAHLSFTQFVITAVFASMAIPVLETPYLIINNVFLLNLAYMVVMPTILALYVMAKYQKYTTPTRSAVIYSMEPPIAAIFAIFLVGELLNVGGIIGMVLILSGLIVSELSDIIFTKKKYKE